MKNNSKPIKLRIKESNNTEKHESKVCQITRNFVLQHINAFKELAK